MKKLFSLLAFAVVSAIVFAFLPVNDAKNDGIDSPSYEVAKHNFYDAYLKYKSNLERGIISAPPVDPSGYFRVDENGNMNMANGHNEMSVTYEPKLSPDVVNNYVFTQSTTTYTSINGTGTLVAGSTNCDDGTFGTFPIGFTFTYNGAAQTVWGCCCNGFLGIGAIPGGTYTPLTTNTNNIAPFAYDLQGAATGSIYYQTTGSAPNRVLTVEFYQWGFWPTTGAELSFEVKLFETTNAVQIVYQTGTHTSTNGVEVGINGSPATDFANRTTTTSWAATTAGATNAATCSFSPTIFPASGLTFQYAPPSPPPVPAPLIRPLNHAVDRPLVDTLQWSASAGATNYNLVIALDSLFTSVVYSDTTLVVTQVTIGTFNPLTNWWWRVRAKNAIGWSAYTTQQTFRTRGPATAPTLITPSNNATNQPIAFTHYWSRAVDQTFKPHPIHVINNGNGNGESVQAISNYWYELYTDTTTTPVIRDSTLTDTTRAVSGLLNNTNYWWRVKAKNDVGWGPFSVYFKFTTVVAVPPAPTNIYPPNNSTGIIPTTLIDWSTSAGATQYRLQVSTDSTFATTQIDTIQTVDSLNTPAGRLSNNVKYYWHVRAQNVGGNSAYGPLWNFTTSLTGVTTNGNAIPNIFKLYQAYPNPFNPATVIKFDLPQTGAVKMEIFNMLGQVVATLVNGNYAAGSYSVTWDAANFSSGVYFYRINAGNYTDIHKMVLIK